MRTSRLALITGFTLLLASCASAPTNTRENPATAEAPTAKRTELSVVGEPKDSQQKTVYCFFDKYTSGDASSHPYPCEQAETMEEEEENDPVSMETCECIDDLSPKLQEYQKKGRSYVTPEGRLLATVSDVWNECGMEITNEHAKVDLRSFAFETLETDASESVVEAEWKTDSRTFRGRFFLKKSDKGLWRIVTSVKL